MKPILIHEKKKIIFLKVTSKLFSEERRLGSKNNGSPENSVMVAVGNEKLKNSMKKKVLC